VAERLKPKGFKEQSDIFAYFNGKGSITSKAIYSNLRQGGKEPGYIKL